jgi:hypothetical protein
MQLLRLVTGRGLGVGTTPKREQRHFCCWLWAQAVTHCLLVKDKRCACLGMELEAERRDRAGAAALAK